MRQRIWSSRACRAAPWPMVSFQKLGSWYLLMLTSVVLVTSAHPPRRRETVLL
jgi:uncharacterized membrane protein YoaT (DUF817 family)